MIRTKDGQTLFDIAVEHYGTWEAAIAIALANGLAMTEPPEDGTRLELPTVEHSLRMERYCKQNGISPATARKSGETVANGIFTIQFTPQFA